MRPAARRPSSAFTAVSAVHQFVLVVVVLVVLVVQMAVRHFGVTDDGDNGRNVHEVVTTRRAEKQYELRAVRSGRVLCVLLCFFQFYLLPATRLRQVRNNGQGQLRSGFVYNRVGDARSSAVRAERTAAHR